MANEVKVGEGQLLVVHQLGAFRADGTLFNRTTSETALDQLAYVNMQDMVIAGVETPLREIGRKLAEGSAS